MYNSEQKVRSLGLVKTRVSEPEPGASYKKRRLQNPETPCRYIIARVMKAYSWELAIKIDEFNPG